MISLRKIHEKNYITLEEYSRSLKDISEYIKHTCKHLLVHEQRNSDGILYNLHCYHMEGNYTITQASISDMDAIIRCDILNFPLIEFLEDARYVTYRDRYV